MCSFMFSPAPGATQKRPGNISASVAEAWAMTAGWYRCPGAVDHPEAQAGGGEGGPQPGPGEAGMALPGGPRLDVVRAHGGIEAGLLRQLDVPEEPAGADLFMRGVETDGSHH